jgi:hypothetical protein
LSHGNYIWLSGGADGDGQRLSDIWRSIDGVTWELVSDSGFWGPRSGHGFVFFRDKFWVFGGYNGSSFCTDIWSSSDCINWTQEVSNVPWGLRHEFGSTIFDRRIWLSGGMGETTDIRMCGQHLMVEIGSLRGFSCSHPRACYGWFFG